MLPGLALLPWGQLGSGGDVLVSLWPVGWALSLQDLSREGVRPCSGQQGPSPPAPAVPEPTGCHSSKALHLFLCRLHLNPPSCLISKANSLSEKSMNHSCLAGSLALSAPHKSERQGCQQDLNSRTQHPCSAPDAQETVVHSKPQRKTNSPSADLCFWGAVGKAGEW